jgi:lipoyl-dependent peroxiredoxin
MLTIANVARPVGGYGANWVPELPDTTVEPKESSMPTRTARTAWNGSLEQGSGQVELSSSGVGTYDVSFPKRAAENADGTTSPEELVAAAHSSCYAMQLSAVIAEAGGTPQSLEVTAEVSLGPDKERGGFQLTGIALKVTGEVDGLDEAGFEKAAQEAKESCPVSKALTGVDITLEARLEG